MQTIYIGIDDSGKLSFKEQICVFGGIIFLNKEELDKFNKDYYCLVEKIKCIYCKNKIKCPELKHFNLKTTHINMFIKYLKKYRLTSCTINNEKIYKKIINNAKSKGRYLDYAIKMMVKNVIKNLISEKIIDKNQDLKIIFLVDEQTYKSNGLYNLKESIYEELKFGMNNIRNNTSFHNLINGKLSIKLDYVASDKNFVIQAADIIAGSVRKNNLKHLNNLKENALKYVNYPIYLP